MNVYVYVYMYMYIYSYMYKYIYSCDALAQDGYIQVNCIIKRQISLKNEQMNESQ